jgi:uncharacterized protein YidB (DUF937 family)
VGLLDQVAGMLGGGTTGGTSSGALIQEISNLLANNAAGGGLGGLVQSFERAGLGHIVNSWIGTGQNLPISPDQLSQVLGSGKIAEIAHKLGLNSDQVAAQLSQLLPHVVDQATPSGAIPADGIAHADVAGMLTSVLGKLSALKSV